MPVRPELGEQLCDDITVEWLRGWKRRRLVTPVLVSSANDNQLTQIIEAEVPSPVAA
jgi:hypothetical protein